MATSAKLGYTAIVSGGTGQVGRQLVGLLSTHPSFSHTYLVQRRPFPSALPSHIETILTPTGEPFHEAIGKVKLPTESSPKPTHAFCCLGTTRADAGSAEAFKNLDLDAVANFAKLAHTLGAHTFVLVSSTGANKDSYLLYPRTKGEAEEAVATTGFKRVVVCRPGLLVCERDKGRFFEDLAMKVAPYFKWVPGSQIETVDVAKAMIVLGLDETETAGAGRIVGNDEMIGMAKMEYKD
ncbi:hypothetical protein BJ742DRAFT_801995 [Cladochytrium replicatum]|nr:hypothetical protein BJ742DRAFT_801995 [Cladochytrium replicatum]